MEENTQEEIRRDIIIGSQCFSNYFWTIFLLIGGISFLLAGISSYYKINFLYFSDLTKLTFIPQGLVMTFYGTLSFSLSIYILLTIFWDIGSGYNEYNKIEKLVKLVRKGFYGKNREILLIYPFIEIKSIGIKISDGINPKKDIYLCLKDKRNIPITPTQQSISILELENKASNLAKFLNLKLETI